MIIKNEEQKLHKNYLINKLNSVKLEKGTLSLYYKAKTCP